MNENVLLKQFEIVRGSTLQLAQDITEENADLVPNGLPNSLRWQLGHVYSSVEGLLFGSAGESVQLPEGFGELFGYGTKPSDWKGNVPKIEELVSLLSEQAGRVKETFAGRLDERLGKPFQLGPLQFDTIGELLSFISIHEGEHHGRVKALKDILKNS